LEIVQSKNKKKHGQTVGRAGDDWYEERLRGLEGVDPPLSPLGPMFDKWQHAVNEFLNGKEDENGKTTWSVFSYITRVFLFIVIVSNVAAVILESVPSIDKSVGNEPGNFFDVFEEFSVFVFATEYILRLFCAPKNREALFSSFIYATTFFGIVDFLSTAPWFIERLLLAVDLIHADDDTVRIFRILRIFRLFQLEDFITAFSKLDNVFRASMDVLKATGLLALIIWVGCGALFFIFEENNPNWRSCHGSIPVHSSDPKAPGCYDFATTSACNDFYPGLCSQSAFTDMPNSLYYTAVFLGGEWGVVDFVRFLAWSDGKLSSWQVLTSLVFVTLRPGLDESFVSFCASLELPSTPFRSVHSLTASVPSWAWEVMKKKRRRKGKNKLVFIDSDTFSPTVVSTGCL
jgi:hypothetical protein